MNETLIKPSFDTLEFVGYFVKLSGNDWARSQWTWDIRPCLSRVVSAGLAEITESKGDGSFMLKITAQPDVARAYIDTALFFDTVEAAAEAAEIFTWEVKELGGVKWHKTIQREDYSAWGAILGEGDKVSLSCNKDGEYHMNRNISPCRGKSYEMSALLYDSGDNKHAVRTFAEAAAIAITLPMFLSVLGAK